MNLAPHREDHSMAHAAPPADGQRAAEPPAGRPKYSSVAFIDAMRQSALGPWMEYFGSPVELEEAFGFAPADASEPYYAGLSALVVEIVTALVENRGAPISVLDVGAGVGRIAYDVARTNLVDQVFALERSPELVCEIAALASGSDREVAVPVTATKNLLARLRPPANAPKLKAVQGDAHRLPFGDAKFSCVVGVGLLDRVERPRAAIEEMARVLQPGGVALVSFLHDPAGGPADAIEWFGSAAELFVGPEWTSPASSRKQRLDLRQNAHYLERFNAEIVVASRAP